jgi:hypothetical protein
VPSRKPDPETEALDTDDELPVVARMVVEIRSDGTRTVARGAIEDGLEGNTVAVEARAGSPLELSRALAKMLFSVPFANLIERVAGTEAKTDTLPRRGAIAGLRSTLARARARRLSRDR